MKSGMQYDRKAQRENVWSLTFADDLVIVGVKQHEEKKRRRRTKLAWKKIETVNNSKILTSHLRKESQIHKLN